MARKKMECRVIITHHGYNFEMGMYDPRGGRYEPLGKHPVANIKKVVGDLKTRMEREGHRVTFSEITGER